MKYRWYIDFNGSKLLMNKLNQVIIAYQEQFRDYSGVISPEICKTTTSKNLKYGFKNRVITLTNGKDTIQTSIIPTNVNQKEMW